MSSFEEQDEALSREEVLRELEAKNDFVFDPETAPKIEHNWTARGIRFVCSGAGHPRHEAFGRTPMQER